MPRTDKQAPVCAMAVVLSADSLALPWEWSAILALARHIRHKKAPRGVFVQRRIEMADGIQNYLIAGQYPVAAKRSLLEGMVRRSYCA